MKTNTFTDGVSIIGTDKIEARKIFASNTTAALEVHIQPGAEIEKHATDEDAFFYILEGVAVIGIGDETGQFVKGNLIECPGGVLKSVSNNTNMILKVLVVKMEIS
jgi:quercetin dioxygenase-like cupin family protein